MTQPTPQTLRLMQMFQNNEQGSAILRYLTEHQANIDVNYTLPGEHPIIVFAALYESAKLMKKILEMGAILDEFAINQLVNLLYFDGQLAQAKEFMNMFLDAGFPREKMVYAMCGFITTTHKDLLKILLEQPVNVNYKQDNDTCLNHLIRRFGIESISDKKLKIFKEMLNMLLKKGANPYELGLHDENAFQVTNLYFATNPHFILSILKTAPAILKHRNNYAIVEPEENIFGEEMEDGTTVAFLDPTFRGQRIVAIRANGTPTNTWKKILADKKNPWTRANINAAKVELQKVVVGPSVNLNGGSYKRGRSRRSRKNRTQRRRK